MLKGVFHVIHSLESSIVLNNGVTMPGFGLGVWKVPDGEPVIHSVRSALEAGYRLIDTAMIYGNERGVGQALRQSAGLTDELFLTTKVWNADQGYDSTLRAFDASCDRLGVETIDLYLIHWPVFGKYKETWKAMEKLYNEGRVRAIGVCNFQPHHLDDLLQSADIVPVVNQVELHPLLTQIPLRTYCDARNIRVEAYSPLGSGGVLDLPPILTLAEKYQKTAAQIILRWDIQNNITPIPRSVQEAHIRSNADVFDFQLSEEDMEKIESLNEGKRFCADPDHFNF